MFFNATVSQSGKLDIKDRNDFALYLAKLAGKDVEVIVKRKVKTRSSRQNAALHLYFTLLATALNDAGLDVKQIVRVDVPFTDYLIKELLWRPTQKKMFAKRSTTQLSSDEVTKVYEVLNRAIGERTGIHIPFPSIEQLMDDFNENQT